MTPFVTLEPVIRKHASNGVLVDTNVLLLYLVGLYDKEYIGSFKRTQMYTSEDFDFVFSFIKHFRWVITTPHILAELSNLSAGIKNPRGARYFASLVPILRSAREAFVEKDVLLENRLLPRMGFTDLSIVEASKRHKYLVLTDDFQAVELLRSEGCDVVNLNYVRQAYWSG